MKVGANPVEIDIGDRREHISRGNHSDIRKFLPGASGRVMVSAEVGARNLTTVIAQLAPMAQTGYHRHTYSEAVTSLSGGVVVSVEGRRYRLRPYESIHIPAGCIHTAYGTSNIRPGLVHGAAASAEPEKEMVSASFPFIDRGIGSAGEDDPEFVSRLDLIEIYELSEGAFFRDLFASRYGSTGICGGYGEFNPGSSLPCHVHEYDESITIINGTAICEVAGKRYTVSDNDTVLVPRGRPHRFLNESRGKMAMVWVYAGDEPERELLKPAFCIGTEHCPCCRQESGN